MVRAAVDHFGRLDIVHSNAASFAMDRTLRMPHMLAQGAGVFVITRAAWVVDRWPPTLAALDIVHSNAASFARRWARATDLSEEDWDHDGA